MAKSVFISSTEKDLREHRRAVSDTINSMRLRAVDMKYFGSAPGGAVNVSFDELAQADFFVGILAHRYGYVPKGAAKSVTEQEYDEAVRRKIPRLMYLVEPDYDWDWPDKANSQEDEKALQQLNQFKRRINQDEVRSLFTTPEDLARKVSTDLARELLKGYRDQRRSRVIAGFIVAAVAVVLMLIAGQDILRGLGILPPVMMPPGHLNVIVAGMGMEQSDGLLEEDATSREVSRSIYGQVQQFQGIVTLGPGDIGIQTILDSTPEARRDAARAIASRLGASVVIYGYFQQRADNMSVNYVPEFYVSPGYTQLQPEALIVDNFGQPVQILFGPVGGPAISMRLQALQLFLDGLAEFVQADYKGARASFDAAIALSPQVAVLYILAGNAAARMNNKLAALTYYTQSLSFRANYSRGLLGRGDALFRLAVQKYVPGSASYDPDLHWAEKTACLQSADSDTPIELLLDLAQICFTEAEKSADQPPAADIDVKVPFERATVLEWRSQNGYGDFWAEAEDNLRTVIALYNSANSDKQSRLHVQAALSHGYLAQLLSATGSDPAPPIAEYQIAIDTFKRDPNQSYAQPRIDNYLTQIATLSATSSAP